MALWVTVKNYLLKQLLKIAPKIGRGFFRSVLGKNKGEVIVYREEVNKNVVCFIHGFSGSAADTFGDFPKLLIEDEQLNGWDVVSIGYASDVMPTIRLGLWVQQPDIPKIASFLRSNLQNLLGRYPRIALVAHSMGGLVVQRTLIDLDHSIRNRVSHVLLYGTPSNGLVKAAFGSWYNVQIGNMAKGGEFIKKLRIDWTATFTGTPPFFFAVVAGQLDEFVPVESSLEPFDKKYHEHTTGNHVDMVKPDNKHHSSYQILRTALVEKKKPYLQLYSNQELNNLRGDAASIIQSFKEQTQLDSRAFRDYIFALDAAGELERGIDMLEASDLVNNTIDFMGILGGRYKRRYLMTNEPPAKDKAIGWYQKAYTAATKQNDHPQIFYASINLAFFYLLSKEDRAKMEALAKVAFDSATVSPSEKWRNATLGEASLYLAFTSNAANINDAIGHYNTAIGQTRDQREKSSMFFNALNACAALGRDDWSQEIERCFQPGSAR